MVVGARLVFSVPYFWARMSGHRDTSGALVYRSRRRGLRRRRPVSEVEIQVGSAIEAPGPTEHFLSARFGLHTQVAGRGVWVPNTHRPWPLRHARIARLRDELVAAAGLPDLPAARPPDHVMFSRGVHTRFGLPRRT